MGGNPHRTPARTATSRRDPAGPSHHAGPSPSERPSRAHRHPGDLLGAMQDFSGAVAAPTTDPAWRHRVRHRLAALRTAFVGHERVTEGPGGLYAELLDTAPRLARAVDVLTREHAALHAAIDVLGRRVDDSDPERFRGWASDLLRELSRHRACGADLIHEAYVTDIGGET